MLCTDSPCEHCAGLILNSGGRVGYVVYGREYRDRAGLDRLTSGGLVVAARVGDLLGGNEKPPVTGRGCEGWVDRVRDL
jgi:hypothetical protein